MTINRIFTRWIPLVFLITLLIVWPSHSQGVPHANHLKWNASTTPGVTAYKVYRGTVAGGPYTLLATLSGSAVMYDDTATSLGARHCYVVTATAGNESIFGSEVCVTDLGTNVNPPTGLAVVPD